MDRTELCNRFITARRAAIGCDFSHLNDTQREAVMTTQGPLLLLAGAGSGKTTVLMNRIENLLKFGCGSDSDFVPEDVTEDDLTALESYVSAAALTPGAIQDEFFIPDSELRVRQLCAVGPVDPGQIVAITFTNKAAGEMKDRLERMLGPKSKDIWAMTFHSACARILRREIDKLGYDRSFTIYDTSDAASLMKRILKELDIEERDFPHKTVLTYISRAKDAMTSAVDFLSSAEQSFDSRRKTIGKAYLEYSGRLKASNALDFDDLILLTVLLFREHPDVLREYQRKFKYVLVDEYQDTNNLQYILASMLAGGYGNICVVGDDDQSIYKFRGATIENILSFERRYKDARVIRLEQNYRSSGHILSAANDVISKNKGRKGKKLWTENDPGEKPELYITTDERVEAQLVADKIIKSAGQGTSWSEHTVLYRMNAQSNQFETAFKRSGIPYRVYGGTGFYERTEIKDMLAYLCPIHNPNDDIRFLRVINNPPRGIGNTTVGRLTEIASEKGIALFELLRTSQEHESIKSNAGRLHMFADMIDSLRELACVAPLDELYDSLLLQTGYIKMLEQKGSDESIARLENVRELKTNIIGFMEENGGSLFDFLSETALFTDLDRDDHSADRVLMMTMHSAKGLEFHTVFVVGAEEGIFPGIRAIGDPGEIEEERRLCYVAMTRAKRKLFFTCTKQRMLFGKTSSSQPSRFIREIDGDSIDIYEPFDTFGGFEYNSDFRVPNSRSQSPNSRFQKPVSEFRTPNSPAPLPELKKGDVISHKAFGRGTVTGISPAGGDALLEIAFDDVGTKRMLLKSSFRYIKIST